MKWDKGQLERATWEEALRGGGTANQVGTRKPGMWLRGAPGELGIQGYIGVPRSVSGFIGYLGTLFSAG